MEGSIEHARPGRRIRRRLAQAVPGMCAQERSWRAVVSQVSRRKKSPLVSAAFIGHLPTGPGSLVLRSTMTPQSKPPSPMLGCLENATILTTNPDKSRMPIRMPLPPPAFYFGVTCRSVTDGVTDICKPARRHEVDDRSCWNSDHGKQEHVHRLQGQAFRLCVC